MKKILKKISIFILSVTFVCSALPMRADASYELPGVWQVQADNGPAWTVKTLDYSYDHNTYFSLRDLAMILKDTDKAFSLDIKKNAVSLNPGNAYTPLGVENVPWESSENPDISLRRNEFAVNGLHDRGGSGHDPGCGHYRTCCGFPADQYPGGF